MSATADPAIRSYFFGKGYRDLAATIVDSWNRNWISAQACFIKGRAHFSSDKKPSGVIFATAGISVVLFGTLVFLVASAAHILILALFFLLIYIAFTLVYLSERGYLLLKRFSAVCPDCHSKAPLPEYFCPRCSAVHTRLIPSSYGILFRTCTCGERLPATFFLKRGTLKSRCPDCKSLLENRHFESRKIFIPLVGGPVVGKSAYLFSALDKLLAEKLSELDLSYSFVDTRTEREVEHVKKLLMEGRKPEKTVATLPRALTIEIQRSGHSPRVLYLYDPAGEVFGKTEDLVLHKFQEYLSGLIFLVDPFAIPEVRREYAAQLAMVGGTLEPSQLPIEDALARILISMEENFGLGKTARIRVPVAVVFNKVDAFDLDQRIGAAAVAARLGVSPPDAEPRKVRDALLREQLIRWEQGDFVQQLEARFERVHYFACSSLGRMPDASGKAFRPRDVLEPLLWILESTDSIFVAAGRRAAA